MEKIASFTINHLVLEPGIYESRVDDLGQVKVVTYDLRLTRPNREPVLNTAEVHTIEHLGATFLRNHETFAQDIIYFGPMGCRTGFYLVMAQRADNEAIYQLIQAMFAFIAEYQGEIPGASARDCGNYLDQNLGMAKYVAYRYLKDLDGLANHSFHYPQ